MPIYLQPQKQRAPEPSHWAEPTEKRKTRLVVVGGIPDFFLNMDQSMEASLQDQTVSPELGTL
jgi:hypothetical protein